jgi:hypothetical protein
MVVLKNTSIDPPHLLASWQSGILVVWSAVARHRFGFWISSWQ